jgi:zinc protease
MAYEADLEKKIEALTPEQIQAALKKHIEPKGLVIVTAGDFEVKAADAAP